MNKKFFTALLVLTALVLSAAARAEGISVLAANFPPYDFARALTAGTGAQVSMLLKPGVESHAFDPSPKDAARIQACDVFLYVGGENEAWAERLLGGLDMSGTRVVRLIDCADTVQEEMVEGMQAEHDAGGEPETDEHIWTSPVNAGLMADAIAGALCGVDPQNADTYRANLADYREKLSELDAAFRAVVAGGVRREIVFADRFPFRYFADEYGLTYYAAFPGCASEAEPSASTMAFLIDKIRADGLPVVYHLEQGSVRVADAIAAETGAQSVLMHSCHNLTVEEFESGETYLSLMARNVEALREGLM